MYCTKCGIELREEANFCSRCGTRSAILPAAEPPRSLMLDKRNKKISGVCAGFARYFGMDIVLMRVLWLVFALGTGVGFLVYIAAWIALPSDAGYPSQAYEAVAPPPLPQRR
jgi:phage shock protein C